MRPNWKTENKKTHFIIKVNFGNLFGRRVRNSKRAER